MRLKRAQVEDAAALAAQMKLVVDEGRWLATQSDRSVEDLTEMFRSGLEDGHVVFMLEDEGQVVGGIGVHPSEADGVLNLGMSILKAHRGLGWGRKLVEAALAAAQATGARKIQLEVFPDNATAISLYVAMGFTVEGLKEDHYQRLDGSIRSVLLMAKFLNRT